MKRKVSELEKDLEASKSQRKDLQHKMEENKTGHDVIVKQLNSEINTLKAKVSFLYELIIVLFEMLVSHTDQFFREL